MKKIVCIFCLMVSALYVVKPVFAQEAQNSKEGICFDSIPFAEACAKAKAENKLVFIDCYIKTCGPCRMMARKVFPQKTCGDYFNPRFVSLKQDMDEGEGPELRKRYGVMIYPTFLFIAPDGLTVLKYEGGADKDAESFVSKIDSALKAMDMYKEYAGGRNDVAFLGDLMSRFRKFDIRKAREIADKSLADASAEVFADSVIWNLLPKILNRTDGATFRRMFDIRDELGSLMGRDIVLEALVKTYSNEFMYRNMEWYDYKVRVRDLETLSAENAPGAEDLCSKVLSFGEDMQKVKAQPGAK